MTLISQIHAREVLDSRGQPTVEVEVHAGARWGRAMVPSGASTGSAEVLELRDRNPGRYDGRGVQTAVSHVNEIIAPQLIGTEVVDQSAVDERLLVLDGTPQKSKLGGNALLGVSLAAAHAGAAVKGVPLYQHFHTVFDPENATSPRMPLPMVNMISGGLHAGGNLDFQDILIEPFGAPDYATGLEWLVRVYRRLGELLTQAGYEGRLVGDEGGYGPKLKSNREAIEFVLQAIEAAGLRPGMAGDVTMAIDVAASHFFDPSSNTYRLTTEGGRTLSSSQMIDRLIDLVREFPIRSIEDGLAEEDWSGWQELSRRMDSRVQLVGDDLFATNPARLQRGIDERVANSVLIKVNQIGTLTETFRTMRLARHAGYTCVVSARSGETEDSTIADLAVGTSAAQIKIGCIVRSERLAKYNQLLRIAEKL